MRPRYLKSFLERLQMYFLFFFLYFYRVNTLESTEPKKEQQCCEIYKIPKYIKYPEFEIMHALCRPSQETCKYWLSVEFFYIKMLSSHFGFGEECGGAITTYSQLLIDSLHPSVVRAYVCVCMLVYLCVHVYCACTCGRQSDLRCHSSKRIHFLLLFWDRISRWPWIPQVG